MHLFVCLCVTVSQTLILCCSVCHRQCTSITASCEKVSCRAFFTSFQPDWVPAEKILSTALQHQAWKCCRQEQASWAGRLWQGREGGMYVWRGRVVAKAKDRLWLDMCQLMIQQPLGNQVFQAEGCHGQSLSMTDSLYL